MATLQSILTEILRISFGAIASTLVLALAYGWLVTQFWLASVAVVWLMLVIIRSISVFVFPSDWHELETRTEKAGAFYASIFKTIVLAPIIAIAFVIRAQTTLVGDMLGTILIIQIYWLLGNLFIMVVWIVLSKREGRRWGS